MSLPCSLITLFEELALLKEFEKRETNFTSKYRLKKKEKGEMEGKVSAWHINVQVYVCTPVPAPPLCVLTDQQRVLMVNGYTFLTHGRLMKQNGCCKRRRSR